MKRILVIGAGRSSSNLIKYLLERAENFDWHVRVGDLDEQIARRKVGNHARGEAFSFNLSDKEALNKEVEQSDIVVSMLPATMHMDVVKACIFYGKNILTPSYIPAEMRSLSKEAEENGIIILCEMGVDPGIDHMSAMKIIHDIQASGGKIKSFKSYAGGLIAPESDNNPWNYKITWNPRNIVMAGAGGTAKFQENGQLKYIPYSRLFQDIERVEMEVEGNFDGYANRDSLTYKEAYGLHDIDTLLRGTLRKEGFCEAWGALISIGLTDEGFVIEGANTKTWFDLTSSFIQKFSGDLKTAVQLKFGFSDTILQKLEWLGIFEHEPLGISEGTPAQALQALIEKKWKLEEGDKDMIVMYHQFEYAIGDAHYERTSSMVCIGDDTTYTAMSKTVGLPLAIAVKLILKGDLKLKGLQMPILPEIYEPVLNELEEFGVHFREKIDQK